MLVPNLRHFCDIDAELGPIREMGAGRAGRRRIIPIVGGSVSGPDISGRLLNLGADWQTIFADGLAELDTRYAMETNDGALIEIVNYGYRHGPGGGHRPPGGGRGRAARQLLHAHPRPARDRRCEIRLGQPEALRRHRGATKVIGAYLALRDRLTDAPLRDRPPHEAGGCRRVEIRCPSASRTPNSATASRRSRPTATPPLE